MNKTAYNRREFLAGLSGTVVLSRIQTRSKLHPKLYYSSVTALAEAIRKKKVSSAEVVNACLKRIEEVNPKLNAVFQIQVERAREEAQSADAALARGQVKGPLHGVPMTIKDSLDTAGVISTAGATGRARYVPAKDATVVARLRAAGAILLGKSNTPEFTGGGEAENLVYGRTNNPYDLTISPSGSSGGEGAIIAAGGSPFGIGSDSGGSVRLPAGFCGVAGIKPTNGRVPLTGHILSYTEGVGVSVHALGPLARYMADLDLILPIIQGVDWEDPFVVPMPLSSLRTVDVRKLRVSFHRDNGIVTPSDEVQRAVQAAASAVKDAGASVDEIRPRGIEEYFPIHKDPGNSNGGASRARLLRMTGTSESRPRAESQPASSAQVDDFLSRANGYRSRMLSFMETYDVIICPFYYQIPQPHGWTHLPNFDGSRDYSYTRIFNTLGWPAAVVRAATSSSGLPIAVQIVARPWRDDVALAVAAVIESKLGGWKPPAL